MLYLLELLPHFCRLSRQLSARVFTGWHGYHLLSNVYLTTSLESLAGDARRVGLRQFFTLMRLNISPARRAYRTIINIGVTVRLSRAGHQKALLYRAIFTVNIARIIQNKAVTSPCLTDSTENRMRGKHLYFSALITHCDYMDHNFFAFGQFPDMPRSVIDLMAFAAPAEPR